MIHSSLSCRLLPPHQSEGNSKADMSVLLKEWKLSSVLATELETSEAQRLLRLLQRSCSSQMKSHRRVSGKRVHVWYRWCWKTLKYRTLWRELGEGTICLPSARGRKVLQPSLRGNLCRKSSLSSSVVQSSQEEHLKTQLLPFQKVVRRLLFPEPVWIQRQGTWSGSNQMMWQTRW